MINPSRIVGSESWEWAEGKEIANKGHPRAPGKRVLSSAASLLTKWLYGTATTAGCFKDPAGHALVFGKGRLAHRKFLWVGLKVGTNVAMTMRGLETVLRILGVKVYVQVMIGP
ncbi:uncharacterized protein PGTG_03484 [Puccinia graminis f. sp. tritici CRL 75-36-700-3]|uniref:Uncharacterized protein n=1 Tax=Puccinia graminis f. sp. tritici (strain CRL 75-36-700-3 / race SCCL) TaxID=418459 RepID=E3JZQ3_PUCGT|nr:uncharacterized protein PGTG_03484 [Puccinia graminis f. sp. tritici CRL 75-36-700-3]EFP77528.1 hypothetical protein PGTG_03484 [Puccinia graminis f. sp. tritici CRL 75-36-700-3]